MKRPTVCLLVFAILFSMFTDGKRHGMSMRGRTVLLWIPTLFLLWILYPLHAGAHFASIGYSDITVNENRIRFDLYLPFDLMGQLIELDEKQLEKGGTDDSKRDLRGFAEDFLKVSSGQKQSIPQVREIALTERGNHRMLRMGLDYPFNTPITDFRLEYHVFFDGFDPGHQNIAALTNGSLTKEVVFDQKNRAFVGMAEWSSDIADHPATSRWGTWWLYTKLGIEHILSGYDHLLFLLGLLLAGGTARELLKLLTAFTVGHSLTLALSVLGILTVTAEIVEPLIALSIVYVAAEVIWKPRVRWRWLVVFLFGLVHGFGFAELLGGKLGAGFALPLFSFNLGVELGQLLVMLLILPALWMLRKNQRFYRVTMGISGLIAAFGMYWFVERIIDL
ncbi:MAG: hypothetical protein K0Q73_6327 [Paenibacillus sp.]|nr:hypothetical protein [Paenibacillus sp.]